MSSRIEGLNMDLIKSTLAPEQRKALDKIAQIDATFSEWFVNEVGTSFVNVTNGAQQIVEVVRLKQVLSQKLSQMREQHNQRIHMIEHDRLALSFGFILRGLAHPATAAV